MISLSLSSIAGFFRKRASESKSPLQLRPNDGQGPYTPYFKSYVPRKIDAEFMEFLREAIPVMDAAINRLVSLDGFIEVEGDNDKLVDEVKDWIYNVPVNDLQRGLQAFHQSLSNEAFEQGFGLGEFVANKQRNDIVSLRTADSKFIKFQREKNGLEILQKADGDNDFRPLKQDNLLYFSINNENQNPYGVPLFRSCEFMGKILATMHNSLLNVWERFGDPSYSIVYKTSKKDGSDLVKRRDTIEKEFSDAIRAKREGKSADFVRAIDTNSEIEIKIIGSDGEVLELEVPSRHVLEQIVAKTGLPPWMLGMHWSTTERLADFEVSMVLADVNTRRAAKMPHFYNLIRTLLLLRGRTWKPGDWTLKWAGSNMHDVVKQAQARFLNAQADMYYLQNAEAAGIELRIEDLALGKDAGKPVTMAKALPAAGKSCGCGCKELHRTDSWPELDTVEKEYEARLVEDWGELLTRCKTILGMELPKGAKDEGDEEGDQPFAITTVQRGMITAALGEWLADYKPSADDSAVVWFYGRAYSLGFLRAAAMTGADSPLLNLVKTRTEFEELCATGFNLVKNNATKAIVNQILPELEAFVITGANVDDAARHLDRLFGKQNKNWRRLVRSELSMAAEKAKLAEWDAWGMKMVEFAPAPDACPICMALAGEYDIKDCPIPVESTHPL